LALAFSLLVYMPIDRFRRAFPQEKPDLTILASTSRSENVLTVPFLDSLRNPHPYFDLGPLRVLKKPPGWNGFFSPFQPVQDSR
jgi:hypothetical protein